MLRYLSFACLAFLGLPSFLLAHEEALYRSEEYNAGKHGDYVEQHFVSTNVTAPRLNFMRPYGTCDDGSYLFIAPRGEKTQSSVCILDASGSLVWTSNDYHGQAYNLQVQEYHGESYLTFWAGDNSVGGHGVGQYFMLDQHYNLFRTVTAANGFPTDLHSFGITPAGTVLLTIYEVIQANLSAVPIRQDILQRPPKRPISRPINKPLPLGPEIGFVWDSLFQEIDIETGELLFQWRASDHFDYQQSYEPIASATEEKSWDWFHLNSVVKDNAGNYLICIRHLRTIANIDGRTGVVLWQLGGKFNSFKDLSDSAATQFIGQHDAQWAPGSNYSEITLFDNRADWTYHDEKVSWGTRVHVDLANMTATLVAEYIHPEHVYSVSQGSYQTLPNGNVLLGYGNNGVVSEFASNGTLLCDAYFEPSKDWTSGNVQSYRNLKFNWTGLPNTKPSLAFAAGSLYMSWHGSTEVRGWLLQHASEPEGSFSQLMRTPKDGFETRVNLGVDMRVGQYVQATALDKDHQILAVSDPVEIGRDLEAIVDEPWAVEAGESDDFEDETEAEQAEALEDVQLLMMFSGLALISSLLLCWLCLGSRILRPWKVVKATVQGYKRSDEFLPVPRGRQGGAGSYVQAVWSSVVGGRNMLYRPLGQDEQNDVPLRGFPR
ncbi:hypothetical protein LTR02_003786 [Friedmanniomyces endolithicus]|nr:hypothetical protein LTR94_012874 [Friedmanniomyces endolithicus]KAK0782171.1 hypothetical protein LTR59_012273 [Friedmanniomyces endolithicus]KAK0818565.1 hypothetical protein LTR38_001147 [Friedmanniomyces endolithicus]KAK0821099.1 hypothetical protein LTR75_001169 [Friedmanniomyces endolithicus]KAK0841418.1 hypothetical protein LTR03_009951 [Friedmanniomyces endolithicus]